MAAMLTSVVLRRNMLAAWSSAPPGLDWRQAHEDPTPSPAQRATVLLYLVPGLVLGVAALLIARVLLRRPERPPGG